jgi:hypothetical protein
MKSFKLGIFYSCIGSSLEEQQLQSGEHIQYYICTFNRHQMLSGMIEKGVI